MEDITKPTFTNGTAAPRENQDKAAINVLKLVILVVLGFAFVMFVFGVGIWVGQKRAEFSYHWAEDYTRNFGGPSRGLFGNFPESTVISGHGVFGQVMKIDGNYLIIKGQNDMEATVVVSPKTTIRNSAGILLFSHIKTDDNVVIIGEPTDNGQIEAKFIRVLPKVVNYQTPRGYFFQILS